MPQRADARRNREAILDTAAALVAAHGAQRLRVADVAARAGVGAGSVYRAFASKSGLLLALLDRHERDLQDALLRGEPPLGPGAPAADRLRAFLLALHELVVEHRELLNAADAGSALAHLRTGAHAAWAQHTRLLLAELHPDADAAALAELVLAPLSPAAYEHALDDLEIAPATLRTELLRLVDGLT